MPDGARRVVFDFDGVVCDSTDECMVTSWNAWASLTEHDGFRRSVAEFTPEERARFRTVRPRVRGAGEYYILRRAEAEQIPIDDQRLYDALLARWEEHIPPFKRRFFAMRDRLRGEAPDRWVDLHPVYPGVIEVMKTLHRENRLYMATLKDGESVRLILGRYGLVLPRERLLDESQVASKVEALNRFRDQLGCGERDLVFIDDNVTHLIDPQEAGYPVYLTTWGNQMKEFIDIAGDRQIPLLDDCTRLLLEVEVSPAKVTSPTSTHN